MTNRLNPQEQKKSEKFNIKKVVKNYEEFYKALVDKNLGMDKKSLK